MTTYTVIATIQSKRKTDPPIDVQHYSGDNLAVALSAMTGAATLYQEPSQYSHIEPDVLRVCIDFDHTPMCGRHGGVWGDDLTCTDCTNEDGTPREVETGVRSIKGDEALLGKPGTPKRGVNIKRTEP